MILLGHGPLALPLSHAMLASLLLILSFFHALFLLLVSWLKKNLDMVFLVHFENIDEIKKCVGNKNVCIRASNGPDAASRWAHDRRIHKSW